MQSEKRSRIYQDEVASMVTSGVSTVAVLPTNSGKTYCATLSIQHYLEHLNMSHGKIIVFIAPSTILCEQQRNSIVADLSCKWNCTPSTLLENFTTLFKDCETIEGSLFIDWSSVDVWDNLFTGLSLCSTTIKEQIDLRDCDGLNRLFFMTPERFLNFTTHGLIPAERVALMILDECHHIGKEQSGMQVMRNWYFPQLLRVASKELKDEHGRPNDILDDMKNAIAQRKLNGLSHREGDIVMFLESIRRLLRAERSFRSQLPLILGLSASLVLDDASTPENLTDDNYRHLIHDDMAKAAISSHTKLYSAHMERLLEGNKNLMIQPTIHEYTESNLEYIRLWQDVTNMYVIGPCLMLIKWAHIVAEKGAYPFPYPNDRFVEREELAVRSYFVFKLMDKMDISQLHHQTPYHVVRLLGGDKNPEDFVTKGYELYSRMSHPVRVRSSCDSARVVSWITMRYILNNEPTIRYLFGDWGYKGIQRTNYDALAKCVAEDLPEPEKAEDRSLHRKLMSIADFGIVRYESESEEEVIIDDETDYEYENLGISKFFMKSLLNKFGQYSMDDNKAQSRFDLKERQIAEFGWISVPIHNSTVRHRILHCESTSGTSAAIARSLRNGQNFYSLFAGTTGCTIAETIDEIVDIDSSRPGSKSTLSNIPTNPLSTNRAIEICFDLLESELFGDLVSNLIPGLLQVAKDAILSRNEDSHGMYSAKYIDLEKHLNDKKTSGTSVSYEDPELPCDEGFRGLFKNGVELFPQKCKQSIPTPGRTLLFCHTKADCQILSFMLNARGIISCGVFHATDTTLGSTTMSVNSQRQIFKDFTGPDSDDNSERGSDRNTNTLRALSVTSIVEEGFDIPKCDLVVRFCDPVGLNKITFTKYLQSKGRVRSEEGRYLVLTSNRDKADFVMKSFEKKRDTIRTILLLEHEKSRSCWSDPEFRLNLSREVSDICRTAGYTSLSDALRIDEDLSATERLDHFCQSLRIADWPYEPGPISDASSPSRWVNSTINSPLMVTSWDVNVADVFSVDVYLGPRSLAGYIKSLMVSDWWTMPQSITPIQHIIPAANYTWMEFWHKVIPIANVHSLTPWIHQHVSTRCPLPRKYIDQSFFPDFNEIHYLSNDEFLNLWYDRELRFGY
eukprot:GHVH01015310.1.p1 GENE.GHVH01015310.1~~GHVH01015310.1.p1  ORF type:complete len:1130 (+),score=155.71 GHVH01015310.1:32-3421(+)